MAAYRHPTIECLGLFDGEVRFSFICNHCGGFTLRVRGAAGEMAMAYCRECGEWQGRLAALHVHAVGKGREAGFELQLASKREWLRPDGAVAISGEGTLDDLKPLNAEDYL